jgi:predicted nuclease with TOPRIM domain
MVALHASQSGDAKQLEENLETTQAVLNMLVADREELTGQLAQMETELDEAETAYYQSKARFPETVASIEYDEEIFSIADDNNLEIISLFASEPRENKVSEIVFANTSFDVEVQGTVSHILNFIDDVVNGGYFEAADVEMVAMEIPEADDEGQPAAFIQIIIYSYEGE